MKRKTRRNNSRRRESAANRAATTRRIVHLPFSLTEDATITKLVSKPAIARKINDRNRNRSFHHAKPKRRLSTAQYRTLIGTGLGGSRPSQINRIKDVMRPSYSKTKKPCIRRHTRKRVLFAHGIAGTSPRRMKKKVFNAFSKMRCK